MTLNIFLFVFSLTGLSVFLATRLFEREGREEKLARSDERIRQAWASFLKQLASLFAFLWEKLKEFWPKILHLGVVALAIAIKIGKLFWHKIKNRRAGEKRGSVSFYLKSVSEYKNDEDSS